MLRRTFILAAAATLAAQEPGSNSGGAGSLAYIQDGTLWIRQLPEGTPRALAVGNALGDPKFSPSGEWILFQDGDDQMRLVSADGKSAKSWPSSDGQWLPGRDRLAILLDEHSLVFDPGDGWTSPRIALPGPIGAISPDGSQRVWESSDEGGKRLLAGPFDRPSEAKLIAGTPEGGFEVAGFARSGSRFLYWTTDEDGADVWAGPLDLYMAGGAQPVKTGACSMPSGVGPNLAPLSPTADTLAIVVGDDGNLTTHDKSLALLDVSSDSNLPLRNLTGPAVSAIYPAWSPDGLQLAWCQGPDADRSVPEDVPGGVYERAFRERRIWLAGDRGLGEPKQLTSDSRYADEVPVWSRDGKFILFARTDEQDIGTVWLMRPDGSDAREVATLSEKDGNSGFQLFDWSLRL